MVESSLELFNTADKELAQLSNVFESVNPERDTEARLEEAHNFLQSGHETRYTMYLK